MTTPNAPQVPALTVQPIRFTSDYAAWKEFYRRLGLRETGAQDRMVTVLAADSGQLMLAEVPAGHELDGVQLVEFTVTDVDAHAAALEDAGVHITRVQPAHRSQTSIAVDLPQGRVHIGPALTEEGAAPFDPAGLNIGALLYCPTEVVAAGAQLLAPYGLIPRIASDSGGWTDHIGCGVFAFHEGPLRSISNEAPNQPAVQVFGETGDVTALVEKLTSAGLDASVVDEAYGLTATVTQPDGTLLTINETQQDLYGYHRLDD